MLVFSGPEPFSLHNTGKESDQGVHFGYLMTGWQDLKWV